MGEEEEELTWMMMSRQIPAPISDGSPYMPVITYTMAWPMVMIIPNTETHPQLFRPPAAAVWRWWSPPHVSELR